MMAFAVLRASGTTTSTAPIFSVPHNLPDGEEHNRHYNGNYYEIDHPKDPFYLETSAYLLELDNLLIIATVNPITIRTPNTINTISPFITAVSDASSINDISSTRGVVAAVPFKNRLPKVFTKNAAIYANPN